MKVWNKAESSLRNAEASRVKIDFGTRVYDYSIHGANKEAMKQKTGTVAKDGSHI